MRLEVTRIRAYDRNPRRSVNPEYDRIEASIRAGGMDQPLVVTQRPGESDYVLAAGGNTRLQVVQALYGETRDERFRWVDCLYRPWQQESDVLLAHLRENDLRGALTFIDKARAVFDAKQLLEQETGDPDISQRRLAALLRERGFSLTHNLISKMGYAAHTLLPLIPQALEAGLGRPQVERIRALDRAARAIWEKRGLGDEQSFDAAFAALCARYDGPEWDLEPLRSAVETEIAEALEVSVQAVRVELDARLLGHDIGVHLPERDVAGDIPEEEETAPAVTSRTASKGAATAAASNPALTDGVEAAVIDLPPTGSSALHTPAPPAAASVGNGDVDDGGGGDAARSEDALQALTEPPSSDADEPISLGKPAATDLKSLRARAWTLATRLAQRNGIGELVAPLAGKGLGFVLRDVPDGALAEQLDSDTLGQVSMLWWHLAACAEMTVAPLEAVVATLSEDSVLRRALESQDAGLLFNSVWTLDPGHTGYRLWRQLGEQDWRDLLNLMDTYRHIHRVAAETQTRLWG